MKQSETITNLCCALIKAQTEIKNLYPSSKGYGYDYVALEQIIDLLKSVLPRYELGYIQLPSQGIDSQSIGITTRIIHSTGEWIEDTTIVPATDVKGTNAAQKLGASITYFRRYALCAAFGITGDKDVDANDKAFNQQQQIASQPTQQTTVEELKNKLQGYLEKMPPNYKTQAENYIKTNNFDGMVRVIDWCSQNIA